VPPSGARIEVEPFMIFRKGLTLLGSFTSLRNSYQAVDWLRSGRMKVDDLVSHRLKLDEFEIGVSLIENGREDVRKVLILPNGVQDGG
jgi:L-iditol 2-dehydrogenase